MNVKFYLKRKLFRFCWKRLVGIKVLNYYFFLYRKNICCAPGVVYDWLASSMDVRYFSYIQIAPQNGLKILNKISPFVWVWIIFKNISSYFISSAARGRMHSATVIFSANDGRLPNRQYRNRWKWPTSKCIEKSILLS